MQRQTPYRALETKNQTKRNKSTRLIDARHQSPALVFDLGYDALMHERELKSLCSQLTIAYGANASSPEPFEFCFSGYKNTFAEKHYSTEQGFPNWFITFVDDLDSLKELRPKVVYLSGDAEDELEKLDNGTAYIIGALVDKNRHKHAAFNRAKEFGIPAFKFKMDKSNIFTVNQVASVLIHYNESKSWEIATDQAVPKRKAKVER